MITQDVPWRVVRDQLPVRPAAVRRVTSVARETLEVLERDLPPVDVIVGLGGGMAIDSAKYVAWRRSLPLVAVPSIVSVDAPFCRAIGVREGWIVEYVGDKMPDRMLVDYALIQGAPPALNRGGICDVLSIWTALEDWRVAHEDTGEPFDAEVARQSRAILNRLMAARAEVYAVSEAGIRAIVEGYLAEVDLCEQWGNARPEEGAEHFFAYALEYVTRRPYLHSAVVSLGVVLMTLLQARPVRDVVQFIDDCGVEWRPAQTGIPLPAVRETLIQLEGFVVDHDYCYSIINRTALTPARVDALLAELRGL